MQIKQKVVIVSVHLMHCKIIVYQLNERKLSYINPLFAQKSLIIELIPRNHCLSSFYTEIIVLLCFDPKIIAYWARKYYECWPQT